MVQLFVVRLCLVISYLPVRVIGPLNTSHTVPHWIASESDSTSFQGQMFEGRNPLILVVTVMVVVRYILYKGLVTRSDQK